MVSALTPHTINYYWIIILRDPLIKGDNWGDYVVIPRQTRPRSLCSSGADHWVLAASPTWGRNSIQHPKYVRSIFQWQHRALNDAHCLETVVGGENRMAPQRLYQIDFFNTPKGHLFLMFTLSTKSGQINGRPNSKAHRYRNNMQHSDEQLQRDCFVNNVRWNLCISS